MKKSFLVFFLLAFFSLSWSVYGVGSFEDIFEKIEFNVGGQGTLFADSELTQATNQFTPGQTVYVRVETATSGDQEKILRLLDENKNEIFQKNLVQTSQEPFVYTTSFAAPETSGIYYVDIKIKSGQGSVFSSQVNLQVGQVGDSVSVSSKAESQADSDSQLLAPELEISPSPRATFSAPSATPLPVLRGQVKPPTNPWQPFWERLSGFLQKLTQWLSFLTR